MEKPADTIHLYSPDPNVWTPGADEPQFLHHVEDKGAWIRIGFSQELENAYLGDLRRRHPDTFRAAQKHSEAARNMIYFVRDEWPEIHSEIWDMVTAK